MIINNLANTYNCYFISPTLDLQASSEAEETLKRIQSHRGVTGILIVNKDGVPIKSTLSTEDTVQYAALITQVILFLIEKICQAIADLIFVVLFFFYFCLLISFFWFILKYLYLYYIYIFS
jgi:hypothetical protein